MDRQQFIYIVRPPRPDFVTNHTTDEMDRVAEHFAYLQRLTAEGTLILAGRCEDARFGIVVLEAADEDAARRLMEADPAVAAGVFSAELIPFRVALTRGA